MAIVFDHTLEGDKDQDEQSMIQSILNNLKQYYNPEDGMQKKWFLNMFEDQDSVREKDNDTLFHYLLIDHDHCEVCDRMFRPVLGKMVNGWLLCPSCQRDLIPCCNCTNLIEDSDLSYTNYNGETFCKECMEDMVECNDCGTMVMNPVNIVVRGQTKHLCPDCHNDYGRCEGCREYFPLDGMNDNGDNEFLCDECNEDYFTCYSCGTRCHADYMYYDEETGENYCERCCNRIGEDLLDMEPCYKIKRMTMSDGAFTIGWELELECDNNRLEIARHIKNKFYPFFWCKKDGSLTDRNGLEIPCQPMTWEYFINEGQDKMDDLLDYLQNSNCRSWNTNAGIHISMGREGFTMGQFYSMLKLFYENDDYIFRISRRSRDKFRRYCDCQNLNNKEIAERFKKDKHREGYEKFEAINIEHRTHYEIRIFAGTLKKESFWGNVEFCRAVWHYCRDTKPKNISVGGFERFVLQHEDKYSHFIDMFDIRPKTILEEEGIVVRKRSRKIEI